MFYPLFYKWMKITAFWRSSRSGSLRSVLLLTCHYFALISFLTYYCTLVIDCYYSTDVDRIMSNLCACAFGPQFVVKVLNLSYYKKNFKQFGAKLENNLDLSHIGNVEADVLRITKSRTKILGLFKLWLVLCLLTCAFWAIYPLRQTGENYIFSLPFSLPHNGIYEIVYFHQTWLTCSCGCFMIAHDFLLFGFLDLICAHFDILMKNLDNAKKIYDRENSDSVSGSTCKMQDTEVILTGRRALSDCIVHHQAILEHVRELNDLYSLPVLTEVLAMTGLTAVVISDLLMRDDLLTLHVFDRVLYSTSAVSDMFLYCYFGEKLATKGEELILQLYELPWYDMSIPTRKVCLQMLTQAQGEVRLLGWKFLVISFGLFLTAMQTAYNMIVIFLQFK